MTKQKQSNALTQSMMRLLCLGMILLAACAGSLMGPETVCAQRSANSRTATESLQPNIHVRTINGLSQRRLFGLAQSHGNRVLSEDEIQGRQRVDVIVALINSMTQQAYLTGDEQAWVAARKVAEDWQRQSQSPRKILIDVQAAMIDQQRLERWAKEVELDTATDGVKQQALATTSRLVSRLDDLQTETRALLNRRPSPREEAEWFKANELLTLRYNLEFEKARAQLNRASMFEPGQELDRDDVLTLVNQQLDSVLKSVRPEQPIWWTVQGKRIAVARSMGDFSKASQIHSGLPRIVTEDGPTSHARRIVKSEWVRTLLAAKKFDAAVTIAGKAPLASKSPELDLAKVELFVAMAGQGDEAKVWQQRALELTQSIEQSHGGYWGRLANLSVVGTVETTNATGGTNLDLLIRVADEAQRKKQWPDALRALDTAYAKAVEARSTEVAWKLGFRAASIEQNEGRFASAATRFESLARVHSDWPDAHTAWLMSCWNLTRIMKGDEAKVQQYETMLTQLVEVWPNSPSADQGRIWLASIRRAQRNWPSAIGLLLEVNAASPLFGKAVAQLRQVIPAFLFQPTVSNESKSNIQSALIVRLAPLVNVDATQMPENWPESRTQIILQLAELKFLHGSELPFDVLPQLQRIIDKPFSDVEKQQAQTLKFLGDNRRFQLATDAAARQRQLNTIYLGLAPQETDVDVVEKSSRFRRTAEQYANEIKQLSAAEQKRWATTNVNALAWANDVLPAIELATSLAKSHPKDAAIQVQLAELLTTQSKTDRDYLATALNQWRVISKSSRKNTARWFTAKFQVAQLMAEQGQTEDALKRLQFIKALPPGWSKAANAAEFDALYQRLGGK